MIPGLNSQANPAAPSKDPIERTRIPMSVPQQKLAVPDIPGFHLHWMLGTQERLNQALKAGYQFVDQGEVEVNNRGLADSSTDDGSTDLGSRVTVVAGGDTSSDGQPVSLVLMKLRLEWWNDDQKKLEEKSDQLAASLRSGKPLPGDTGATEHRYVDPNRTRTNMFTPKRRA